MTIKERLAHQRKRRQKAQGNIARIQAKVRTRLARLAHRPALAAYVARTFGLRWTSGWRSVAHNATVGGVVGSWHTKGTPLNPKASDWVGPQENMEKAAAFLRGLPGMDEVMIHDAGSGKHLHAGGEGVATWRMPKRGWMKRWTKNERRWRKIEKEAEERIGELKADLAEASVRERKTEAARRHGAAFIGIIWDACQKFDIPFALGLAIVQQESGFLNQYGHDRLPGQAPIWHGKTGRVMVTAANIKEYLSFVKRTGGRLRQGVGPMQLTSGGYQDEAVERGGLHKPEVTIPYGLEILDGHMKALGTMKGIGAYNGGRGNPQMDYARSVKALWDRWADRLD